MFSYLSLWLTKIPVNLAKARTGVCYYPTGKEGEDLLNEVASRYVEGMKDMEGRKPGPSSILGKWEKKLGLVFKKDLQEFGWVTLLKRHYGFLHRCVSIKTRYRRRLQNSLQSRGNGMWSCHEVHVHWAEVRTRPHWPVKLHVRKLRTQIWRTFTLTQFLITDTLEQSSSPYWSLLP